MKALILFDIDKTLLRKATGHGDAFKEGFKRVFGISAAREDIIPHGMTDQQIIIEVMKKNGLTEKEILPKVSECMQVMTEYFSKKEKSIQVEVLPGAGKLLEELQKRGYLMGLVTGNLETIGRGKMKKAHFNQYFSVGGFGSDHIDRTELAKIAIKRAKEQFNFVEKNNVFHFGDSPQDMKVGYKTGIITIGVTTGKSDRKALEKAGADYVFDSLESIETILDIISSHL